MTLSSKRSFCPATALWNGQTCALLRSLRNKYLFHMKKWGKTLKNNKGVDQAILIRTTALALLSFVCILTFVISCNRCMRKGCAASAWVFGVDCVMSSWEVRFTPTVLNLKRCFQNLILVKNVTEKKLATNTLVCSQAMLMGQESDTSILKLA